MKQLLTAGLLLLWFSTFSFAQDAVPNTLTAAEKKEGWELLFDGKSMEHFRNYRKASVSDGWKVQDGEIRYASRGAGDIITRQSSWRLNSRSTTRYRRAETVVSCSMSPKMAARLG